MRRRVGRLVVKRGKRRGRWAGAVRVGRAVEATATAIVKRVGAAVALAWRGHVGWGPKGAIFDRNRVGKRPPLRLGGKITAATDS